MLWNFDNEQKIIDWIIDNKNTDKATALMIYWLMEVGFSKKYASREEVIAKGDEWYLDNYDLIQKIEKNLVSDFYENQNFAYNPFSDKYGYNRIEDAESYELVTTIPDSLKVILKGEKISEIDRYDGIPKELLEEYDALAERIDEELEEE